jgi:hypothetical protein
LCDVDSDSCWSHPVYELAINCGMQERP